MFLLHPVQTQTVSYVIQGQLEGFSSLFILLAITSFYFYLNAKKPILKIFSLISILFFLVSAASTKEISIIAPFLILLVDWFWFTPNNTNFNNTWHNIKTRFWLYLLLIAVTFGVYIYFLKPSFFINIISGKQAIVCSAGNAIANNYESKITQYYFFISQFKVILHYIWIFIWPLKICVEYDWQICNHIWDLDCVIPGIFLIFLAILIYRLIKKNHRHPIAFGALWFLICILPRSSIIASAELVADYKTYLASFGIFIILGYFANLIINRLNNFSKSTLPFWLINLILIAVLCYATIMRNQVWSSSLNFWYNIICNAPKKARGFNNYGVYLIENKEPEKSIFYLKRAIDLHQSQSSQYFYSDPYQNLANAYALTNHIDLAIEVIKKGLAVNPNIAEMHNNLGALYLHQNKINDSIYHLKIANHLNPQHGHILYNLGRAYLMTNQIEDAWNCLKKACLETHIDRLENALELYAEASIKLQKLADATFALQKILKSNPNNLPALFNLAAIYYHQSNYDGAKECYQKILAVDSNNQLAKDKLAVIINKLQN